MSAVSLFSSVTSVNRAQRLEEESFVAILGSVEADFTRQALQPGDHTISVVAVLGSVKLIFPAEVELRIEGSAMIFGGVDHRGADAQAASSSQTRVTVKAVAVFGGVEVLQVASDESQERAHPEIPAEEQYARPHDEPAAYEGVTRKIGQGE